MGLGGLGFTMGISGSWMLFTGLLGAWLCSISDRKRTRTQIQIFYFPANIWSFLQRKGGALAGIISAIGYIGFPVRRFWLEPN
jgi:SSS family solute:Na+ symporter